MGVSREKNPMTRDSDDMLAEGTILKVSLEVRLPIAASMDDVEKWLRFSLEQRGSFPSDNPLIHHHPETFGPFGFDWEVTNEIGREERTLTRKDGDTEYYSVRYIRERA